MDGAAIPWNASVKEFQRGHSAYIAGALEQPLLLPKDMDAIRKLKQQDLFMPLKRDLAMVSSQPHTFYLLSTSQFSLSLSLSLSLVHIGLLHYFYPNHPGGLYSRGMGQGGLK